MGYNSRKPGSMAIVCMVIIIFYVGLSTARYRQEGAIKKCVKIVFNPQQTGAKSKIKAVACKDLLRSIGLRFKRTHEFPREYMEALKKVPKFKHNPPALKDFICHMAVSAKAASKYGCNETYNVIKN